MASHPIYGQDISSFDLPSTHRLPTVSAADALEELHTDHSRFLSTGLHDLDQTLNPQASDAPHASPRPGGFQKGQVVEVWGPPGSGKTNLGLQLTCDALRTGRRVVWVDAFRPAPGARLREMLDRLDVDLPPTFEAGTPTEDRLLGFLHFTCPSLSHLIALLCRPTASCMPEDTSLIVVDSLSVLVNQAFPKVHDTRKTPKGVVSTSARRLQVLQFIISSLQKLAATRDVAVVILSHCATRMQAERGATLIPAINASSWEQSITTRLVLFRDWSVRNGEVAGLRFAGIQKLNGKFYAESIGPVFAFDIQTKGLVPVEFDGTESSLTPSSALPHKRKLGKTDFEIADSEEEDYGWDDEDATQMPPNPSQWQGSEDLFLGQHDDNGNRRDESSDGHFTQEELDADDPHLQDVDDGVDESPP